MLQSPLTRNVSLFLGPIYASVSTHPECILVPWSNICFSLYSPGMYPCSLVQYMLQFPLTRNVSLFLGPIYVSVSTHPECILDPWSNICFSFHSPGMYPCSLDRYYYVSASTHLECILVPWSNTCFSLYSPGMYPCSLVQYMLQFPITQNVSLFLGPIYASVSTHPECILVPWTDIIMFQPLLTWNVSLFLGPIHVSVSTHLECILVPWSNICFSFHSPGMYPCFLDRYMFQPLLTWNVSLFLGPIYVSVSTHLECILVPWSNICSSLYSPGMYPCSLVQYIYMFQSPLSRNVSLFLAPIYALVSTHLECILVPWSNKCFSLYSPGMYPCCLARYMLQSPLTGMYPCSLVQYMFQSPITWNVSLFLGPIYVSVSTHPECILVPWPDICSSLYSPGMYRCSMVQYMFQSPLTRNVSLFLGPIYVSVSTHPECILVPWPDICFSLYSPGMYPCCLVQYMLQSPLTRNVSLFLGPIYVSVSTHLECILVPWSNICFSLYSPGMYPCSLVQYNVSVSTHPECILVHWSNICFSLYSPGMYPCSLVQYNVSVSTHPECILVPWSNICFSLYSPGMYPCSLVQYMFQSLLTRNVSLFLGPI